MNTPSAKSVVNPKPLIKDYMILDESHSTLYLLRDNDGSLFHVDLFSACTDYGDETPLQHIFCLLGKEKFFCMMHILSHGYWIGDFVSATLCNSEIENPHIKKDVVLEIVAKRKIIRSFTTHRTKSVQVTKNFQNILAEYKSQYSITESLKYV